MKTKGMTEEEEESMKRHRKGRNERIGFTKREKVGELTKNDKKKKGRMGKKGRRGENMRGKYKTEGGYRRRSKTEGEGEKGKRKKRRSKTGNEERGR